MKGPRNDTHFLAHVPDKRLNSLWIISPEERAAYLSLSSDEERDHFIEQFWLRYDEKGEPAFSYRTENYKRLAYVNTHFASSIPGWKTDRGHAYIVYGKPDSIDSHPTGATSYESWHYANVQGKSIDFRFVDACQCGDYRLDRTPSN